ncbi:MAG: hypoxanthine phosphoribosyltransferase [Elusimicrobiales bacterium]|nr:hypoxanthine phosphoribosyltransferase [Elusimicrobiales bacterium]
MHKDIKEILFSKEVISKRVNELAKTISSDYKNKNLFMVGVLKGCFMFLSDLVKDIKLDLNVDFMMISSYEGKQSSGVVRILLDLKQPIEGRDVLIIEDIVDTGLTINYLIKNMKARNPASLEVCTLLNKPSCRKIKVNLKYVGFDIPDKFVVGYGLDYKEYYRNLPYIGVLKDEVI